MRNYRTPEPGARSHAGQPHENKGNSIRSARRGKGLLCPIVASAATLFAWHGKTAADGATSQRPTKLSTADMDRTTGGINVHTVTHPNPSFVQGNDNVRVEFGFHNNVWGTSSVNVLPTAGTEWIDWPIMFNNLQPPNYAGLWNRRGSWPPGPASQFRVHAAHPNDPFNWQLSHSGPSVRIDSDVRVYGVRFFNARSGSFAASFSGGLGQNVLDPNGVTVNLTPGINALDGVYSTCGVSNHKRQQWRYEGISVTANLPADCIDFPNCTVSSWSCRHAIGQATGNTATSHFRVVIVREIGGGGSCSSSIDGFQQTIPYQDTGGTWRWADFVFMQDGVMTSNSSTTNWLAHEIGHSSFKTTSPQADHTCANGRRCEDSQCTCPTQASQCPAGTGTNVMCPIVRGRALSNHSSNDQCATAASKGYVYTDLNN